LRGVAEYTQCPELQADLEMYRRLLKHALCS